MNPTKEEKAYHDRLCTLIGCIACWIDGNPNYWVSVHHIKGRTKAGCHKLVFPLCSGHHQDGTGNDKTLIAIHPYKRRFEARYGSQMELKAICDDLLKRAA